MYNHEIETRVELLPIIYQFTGKNDKERDIYVQSLFSLHFLSFL